MLSPRVRLVFLLCACVATSTECDSWDEVFFYCCYCTVGSALQVLCQKMDQNGEMFGARSRLKALEFLLSVGADPNKRSLSPGDIANTYAPPLHLSLQISDASLAKRTCELLLQHKANPTAIFEGRSAMDCALTPGSKLSFKTYIKRFKNEPRPPRLCPCGSMRLFPSCHGHAQGVPVHPRAPCPCRYACGNM